MALRAGPPQSAGLSLVYGFSGLLINRAGETGSLLRKTHSSIDPRNDGSKTLNELVWAQASIEVVGQINSTGIVHVEVRVREVRWPL